MRTGDDAPWAAFHTLFDTGRTRDGSYKAAEMTQPYQRRTLDNCARAAAAGPGRRSKPDGAAESVTLVAQKEVVLDLRGCMVSVFSAFRLEGMPSQFEVVGLLDLLHHS